MFMLLLRKHRLCILPSTLGGIVKNIQQLVVIARHIYPFLLKTGKHSLASLESALQAYQSSAGTKVPASYLAISLNWHNSDTQNAVLSSWIHRIIAALWITQ